MPVVCASVSIVVTGVEVDGKTSSTIDDTDGKKPCVSSILPSKSELRSGISCDNIDDDPEALSCGGHNFRVVYDKKLLISLYASR